MQSRATLPPGTSFGFDSTVASEVWPYEIAGRATGSDQWGSMAKRSSRTTSWTGKCPGRIVTRCRKQRDNVPLVVDGADRIVWVAGFGIDEAFRVTDRAQEVIILTLKVLGGSA